MQDYLLMPREVWSRDFGSMDMWDQRAYFGAPEFAYRSFISRILHQCKSSKNLRSRDEVYKETYKETSP